MHSEPHHAELEGWQPFIGTWETEATHPMLPGAVMRGQTTFEWLEGRRFVIERTHNEHPDIPDAIAVIGVIDGDLSMHYFDQRGVFRVYSVSLTGATWRFWRNAPGFSQRYTANLSAEGDTITVHGELSRDGETWEGDLASTYRRVRNGAGA